MTDGFDANSLQRRYAFVDACPKSLFAAVATLPFGNVAERVAGIGRWREALLAGRPPPEGWPEPAVGDPVRQALDALGVARFCKDQPELVDALLQEVVAAFARQSAVVQGEVAARLKELEDLERVRLEEAELARARRERVKVRDVDVDEATRRRLHGQAAAEAARQVRDADGDILARWGDRVRAWAEIADVFGDLGQMMGRGWDLAQGALRHSGWLDVVRLRQLVEQLPQLREIVQSLGRLQVSESAETVSETLFVPVRRVEEERYEVRTPHVPAETRGVERSGEIARMLPAEALMLGHPKLRYLWHARRAERALVTYRVEGIEIERRLVERESYEDVEGKRPRPHRGPIVAVIDTSGSMHGLPETIAKAVVLEALRTAHAERRRCYLYAYSGPGDVLEHELALSAEGIGELLAFLGVSFGGGTDIGAMTTVVQRLRDDDWRKADVVLVTDGEWSAPSQVVAGVAAAKENGTRFHGVQIGNRGHSGLQSLCDPVHVFADWAALASWR